MTDTVNTHLQRALGIHQRLNGGDIDAHTIEFNAAQRRFDRSIALAQTETLGRAADALEELIEQLRPQTFTLSLAGMPQEARDALGANDDDTEVVIPIHPTTRKGAR